MESFYNFLLISLSTFCSAKGKFFFYNRQAFTNLPDEKKILFSVPLTRITPLNVVEGLGKVAASMANGGSVDGVTILSNKGWQVNTVNMNIIIYDYNQNHNHHCL